MKLFNGMPIFLLNVEDPKATITTMSLVDCPAMDLPMFCFNKEEKLKFSLQEPEHNIISCIIRVDYPILRTTKDGEGYYVIFNKDTSKSLCQKLMTDGYQQNISLDHNGQLIDGIKLQEVFIKDSAKGISPIGFEDAADGSLFGIYHITDEQLWQDCLEGKFGGISLESYFKVEEFSKQKKYNYKNKMSKVRKMLEKILLEFGSVETDKGLLEWEGDKQLEVGDEVFMNDATAEDGEYVVGDKVFVVVEGKVAEVRDMAVPSQEGDKVVEEQMVCGDKKKMEEETIVEEVKEEIVEEPKEEVVPEIVKELVDRVAELEAKIMAIEDKMLQPAAEPVVEEFEKVTAPKTTGNKNIDKWVAIASSMRK